MKNFIRDHGEPVAEISKFVNNVNPFQHNKDPFILVVWRLAVSVQRRMISEQSCNQTHLSQKIGIQIYTQNGKGRKHYKGRKRCHQKRYQKNQDH